jgi:MoxR-like ATPase
MKFMQIKPDTEVPLASGEGLPELVHVFDEKSIDAVNAALAAGRPLLVRGEPGIGKSQLARAAAKVLGRAYIQRVVDARTESRDLLWHFDAVARLAEAQLSGALGEKPEDVRDKLSVDHYLRPGPLWWAFDWQGAKKQADRVLEFGPPQFDGGNPAKGCVMLVDEIDKAESDLPNGLLEALGSGQFTPPGSKDHVIASGIPPLVIITTNEERTLPDAFMRRCLVLFLRLPEKSEQLVDLLMRRGCAHFPPAGKDVLRKAAQLLVQDREQAQRERHAPLPGQAEYLDLVRAVLALAPRDPDKQAQTLDAISEYILKKRSGSLL